MTFFIQTNINEGNCGKKQREKWGFWKVDYMKEDYENEHYKNLASFSFFFLLCHPLLCKYAALQSAWLICCFPSTPCALPAVAQTSTLYASMKWLPESEPVFETLLGHYFFTKHFLILKVLSTPHSVYLPPLNHYNLCETLLENRDCLIYVLQHLAQSLHIKGLINIYSRR